MKRWEYERKDERLPLNKEKIRRGLGKELLAKLDKIYKPSSRFDLEFKGNDITFLTNQSGEPMVLYIGKRKEDGDIAGVMYSRRIKNGKMV
jgi:hypothetical protein